MSTETRSPAEIEKDIESDRERLSDTLNEVQDRFSVERIARQVSDQFGEHGGDIGRSVSESLKKNPLAVAVTGVGLAWLIFGNGRGQPDLTKSSNDDKEASVSAYRDNMPQRSQSAVDATGSHRSRAAAPSRRNNHALPVWAKSSGNLVPAGGRTDASASGQMYNQDTRLGEDTLDTSGTSGDHLRSGASSVSERAAKQMRDQFSHGTEDMSDAARDRIISAREQAMQAYHRVSDAAQKGGTQLADFYDNQPLVIGALGLALGAAIGALAPRTQMEDDIMGAQRDHLFAEAERIYDEEKGKLETVIDKTVEETQSQVSKVSETVSKNLQSSVDEVKSAATKVAETTRDEASSQDLGKPST